MLSDTIARMRKITAILLVFVGAFSLAPLVQAHSSGLSFEATSTPYIVDIGYDIVSFYAGESVRFDFTLKDEKTDDEETFDHVWIRILRDSKTLLATGIRKQEIGPTTLLFVFPLEGLYTLETSYRSADGEDIAKATFPISVLPIEESLWSRYGGYMVPLLAGLLIGAAAVIIFRPRMAVHS